MSLLNLRKSFSMPYIHAYFARFYRAETFDTCACRLELKWFPISCPEPSMRFTSSIYSFIIVILIHWFNVHEIDAHHHLPPIVTTSDYGSMSDVSDETCTVHHAAGGRPCMKCFEETCRITPLVGGLQNRSSIMIGRWSRLSVTMRAKYGSREQ